MTDTLEVANTVVVVPKLDYFIVARGYEVLALGVDGECIELTSFRAIKHADSLAIVAVPVGNLVIGAGSQDL